MVQISHDLDVFVDGKKDVALTNFLKNHGEKRGYKIRLRTGEYGRAFRELTLYQQNIANQILVGRYKISS